MENLFFYTPATFFLIMFMFSFKSLTILIIALLMFSILISLFSLSTLTDFSLDYGYFFFSSFILATFECLLDDVKITLLSFGILLSSIKES